jgi:hypothetical protein
MIPLWISLLSFGLRNWKYILIVFALIAAGFYAQIQGIRVEKIKIEVSRLQADIAACQDANKSNQKTITSLISEIENSQSLCNSRLGTKDKVIKRLQKIDSLKVNTPKAPDTVALTDSGRSGSKNVEGHPESALYKNKKVDNEKGIDASVDDPVLHELNRMFIIKADSKD